jgi:hypothetical protein
MNYLVNFSKKLIFFKKKKKKIVVKSIPRQFFPPTSRHMAAAVNLGEADVAFSFGQRSQRTKWNH